MKNKRIAFLVQTVIVIALLVGCELLSKVLPTTKFYGIVIGTFITDALNAFILTFSATVFTFSCSAAAAVIAPIILYLLSMGSSNVPAVTLVYIAGNLSLVFMVWVCNRASKGLGKYSSKLLILVGIVLGALMKMLTMSQVTEKFVITYLKVSKDISNQLLESVSMEHFYAVLVGGVLAFLLLPFIKTAFKSR